MKKIFLLLGFLFFLGSYHSLKAQNKNLRIGVRVMPGLAQLYHPPVDFIDFKPKFVLNGGVLIEGKVLTNLHLESGIYFQDKGQISVHEGDKTEAYIYYLSIPVLAKVYKNSFYGAVGPAMDIFLNFNTSKGKAYNANDGFKNAVVLQEAKDSSEIENIITTQCTKNL